MAERVEVYAGIGGQKVRWREEICEENLLLKVILLWPAFRLVAAGGDVRRRRRSDAEERGGDDDGDIQSAPFALPVSTLDSTMLTSMPLFVFQFSTQRQLLHRAWTDAMQ